MAQDCSGNCVKQNKVFDDYETYLTQYLQDVGNLALLLDYDGTLTPIVAHPDLAKIPPETKKLLEELASVPNIFLAIISGRNPDNVKQMVGLENIVYAGNHGLEVLYPDGKRYNHQLPTEFGEQVKQLLTNLEKSVVKDGAWIENKGASLTFHFRAVPPEKVSNIEKTAREIIEQSGFKVNDAHMALEARPKVEWNKGSIALLLLDQKFGKDKWQGTVRVIFAGDDTTDEDAMKALKGHAATFRIATDQNIKTSAEKLLSSTNSVIDILRIIKKIYKK
ncbi:uncharacterized protein LOC126741545 [Anthonomus grandis grandis]|uniref:uncharacterized protein LOC126741545 n=1 Tax=Anthonomus grandis grandis TaxID=2921223 RepID=UPI00216565E7|nr:uncharacterized protein LOC126741545 [Anthonomus grandis grandis]